MSAAKKDHGLLKFLGTSLPEDDLKTALRVIEAFKKCESADEWMSMPFSAWLRLEQLEDYLGMLTDPEHETDDTRALNHLKKLKKLCQKKDA